MSTFTEHNAEPAVITYAGLRAALGPCRTCGGVGGLCQSETGRLDYYCSNHLPWTFRPIADEALP